MELFNIPHTDVPKEDKLRDNTWNESSFILMKIWEEVKGYMGKKAKCRI